MFILSMYCCPCKGMPTNAVASKATKIETTKEDLHYTTGERELKKADHFAAIHQPDKAMEYYMSVSYTHLCLHSG